jgi:DNA repair protein SbcD/Mre11
MPIRPFQFVHASDLHLERPPSGVEEVPDHLKRLFIDAAYRAAEKVFDTAVTSQADFLLLVGDILDPDLAGPRGCVFLSDQCERLKQRGIKVYWAGGRSDHAELWPSGLDVPDNVHLFPRGPVTRVVHERDEEPLAELLGVSRGERKRIRPADFAGDPGAPFTIAVTYGTSEGEGMGNRPVHYWALGGEHTRRTLTTAPAVAHYPGTPQGRRPRDSGPRGCTVVQVDDSARVRTNFVATDVLRWQDERVLLTQNTPREQFERQLHERATALWGTGLGPDMLVSWTVVGSPALGARLQWGTLETELLNRLRNEFGSRRPGLWSASIGPDTRVELPAKWYEQESLLGEMLRSLRKLNEPDAATPDLHPLLPARDTGGLLAGAVNLTDPATRAQVLEEAALLAVDMLSHEESPS